MISRRKLLKGVGGVAAAAGVPAAALSATMAEVNNYQREIMAQKVRSDGWVPLVSVRPVASYDDRCDS
jgi:hypothetical protein